MQFTSRPIGDAELEHLYGGKVPSKLDNGEVRYYSKLNKFVSWMFIVLCFFCAFIIGLTFLY